MSRFANSYWSPDNRTSIEKLANQLQLSFGQLHELRRLVFNHIKYHHANGEFLADAASSSYPIDSSFRSPTSLRKLSSLRKDSAPKTSEIDLKFVFHQYVERIASELYAQQALASEIDSAVLETITRFIKHYEPQINATLMRFEELLQEYEASYEKIENLKLEYDSHLNFAEFNVQENNEVAEAQIIEMNGSDSELKQLAPSETAYIAETSHLVPTQSEKPPSEDQESEIKDDYGFKFPMDIGGVLQFNSLEEFSEFLTTLTNSIEVSKRKIPILGHTNELFSSNQLCEHFTKSRPPGFNPTRSNLEKLGQNLMNLKIIVSTGFFAKKFTSEGMWFEWSDKVMQIVQRKPTNEDNLSVSLAQLSSQIPKMRLDDTQKFMNDMAASTSKTFNGMFKSMKSSLMGPKYSEDSIRQVEENYNEAYEELQRLKHLLDLEFHEKLQLFEHFERLKIEVIYQSLTKLLEVVYKHSLQSTTALHDFTQKFIEKYNKPENYKRDYATTLETFSTGIYFPSFIAPDHLTRKHINISLLNTNFQNLKLGFNLYKDVPLQLKMNDLVPPYSSIPMNVRSIPIFLFEVVNHLNNQEEPLQNYWIEPINHQDYWLVKYEIIGAVQEFLPDSSTNVHDQNAVESAIIVRILIILKEKNAQRIINFLKNWLLEISDSVIPSTVYDSLLGTFKGEIKFAEEVVRILNTIPRSNLSSLICILEHISKAFDLSSYSTENPEHVQTDSETMANVSKNLNRMEAVGAVPFVHLILRPSVVKHATGFKPPMEEYEAILTELLSVDVRSKLVASLVDSEKRFIEKQEQQTKNLGIVKKYLPSTIKTKGHDEHPEVQVTPDTPTTPTKIVSSVSQVRSPNPGDSFSLRPFRTGTTPRPSPTSSPVHQIRRPADENHVPKSSSTNFLAPTIDIKFEN